MAASLPSRPTHGRCMCFRQIDCFTDARPREQNASYSARYCTRGRTDDSIRLRASTPRFTACIQWGVHRCQSVIGHARPKRQSGIAPIQVIERLILAIHKRTHGHKCTLSREYWSPCKCSAPAEMTIRPALAIRRSRFLYDITCRFGTSCHAPHCRRRIGLHIRLRRRCRVAMLRLS